MLLGMSAPLLIIVNPASAGGRGLRRAEEHVGRLLQERPSCEVRQTEHPRHAEEIARSAFVDEGVRQFVAVGGDGTALEVLNGALPAALSTQEELRLGVLPVGTGNSFAHHLAARGSRGATSWAGQAAATTDAILEDRRIGCDVLEVTHSEGVMYALGSLACGLPATIADLVNRRLKRLGRSAYTLGAVLEVMRGGSIGVKATGQCQEQGFKERACKERRFELDQPLSFYCVQNIGTTGGNMWMAPDASPSDGVFDLVLVTVTSRFQLLKTLPRIYSGAHIDHPAVTIERLDRLDLKDDPARIVMLDGEIRRLALRTIALLPRCLTAWSP